ncbi:MAG: response regulator [Magnetococcales bacterium]|nr:response regulator [Magnetococcales bacterium]
MKREKETILIVDDEPSNIEVLDEILHHSYTVIFATSGSMALEVARSSAPHLILLDVMMPAMDGYEVCRQLKQEEGCKAIPVIFVTTKAEKEDIARGLQLGAYYYLTKPVDRSAILAVVETALHEYGVHLALQNEVNKAVNSFRLMESGLFRFRTLEEVQDLVVLLAKACPNPEKSLLGLTELMINAVEHGNLGIGYRQKSQLNRKGGWSQEVERRLSLPEYAHRSATIQFSRDQKSVTFVIQDQGEGFDWQNYLQIDPARAFDSHGRGIAMANLLSFDAIHYQGRGNEVVATINLPESEHPE